MEEGASFATKAILYSEDPGSANNGGQYLKVSRGKMVKEFDAVAFNLEEGEISEPFKTEFGYHIIKLDKRRGQELDLRHILISLKPTEEEMKSSLEKLDSVRILINEDKMTFKDASVRFSDDKFTKYNEGNLINSQSGDDRFEKINLPVNEFSAILSLNEGDISEAFVDDYQGKKVVRLLRLNKVYPEHKINYEDDYYRIKQFTTRYKEQDVLVDWVKKQIPDGCSAFHSVASRCKSRLCARGETSDAAFHISQPSGSPEFPYRESDSPLAVYRSVPFSKLLSVFLFLLL